jgi:hypothetical protein
MTSHDVVTVNPGPSSVTVLLEESSVTVNPGPSSVTVNPHSLVPVAPPPTISAALVVTPELAATVKLVNDSFPYTFPFPLS